MHGQTSHRRRLKLCMWPLPMEILVRNRECTFISHFKVPTTKVNETLANFMLTLYLGTTSRLLVFGKTRTYHCFNGTRTKVMKLKRCLFQLANREAPLPRDFPLLY